MWTMKKTTLVVGGVCLAAVACFACILMAVDQGPVTEENANKIKEGMSLADVEGILGPADESVNHMAFAWIGSRGGCWAVLEDGRVSNFGFVEHERSWWEIALMRFGLRPRPNIIGVRQKRIEGA